MNLFPRQITPYYVYAPSYTHTSSGVRTLHLLVHALNQSGQKAYLIPSDPNGYATNPELNTPLLLPQHQNYYGDNFIAVYPDIVRGNPFNAERVVRYLLAPAGAYGGDATFAEGDQIWGALPSLAENILRIPVSDPEIFYPSEVLTNGTIRVGSCFYSHKYEMHGNQPLDITKNSVRLEGSLKNLADTMRQSTVCYLYELTSVITEAALCGCPVVLVRTPYFNTIDPACMMGDVSWSDGEIVKECNDYREEYYKICDNLMPNLIDFVQKTKKLL